MSVDPHVEPWLDRYRTGELEEAERLWVEAHLGRCAECTRSLEELAAFSGMVGRAYYAQRAVAGAREPAWERMRGEILARTAAPRRAPRSAGSRASVFGRYAPQAALAVLALVALGVLYQEGVRGPEDARRRLAREPEATSSPRGPASSDEVQLIKPLPGEPRAAQPQPGPPVGGARRPSSPQGAQPPELLQGAGPADAPSEDERARQVPSEAPPAAQEAAPAVAADAAGEADVAADAADEADQEYVRAPAERRAVPSQREEAVVGGEREQRAAKETREALDADLLRREAALAAADTLDGDFADEAADAGPAEDVLQRFEHLARRALASGDSLEAARALAFWRDSVEQRADLSPERESATVVLIDSLVTLVETE